MDLAQPGTFGSQRATSDPTRILVAALTVILLLFVVPPLWFLLLSSLHTTTVKGGLGDFTLAYPYPLGFTQLHPRSPNVTQE